MIIKSPFADVSVPNMPLHQFVLQRATELGDKPALVDGPSGRTLSYAQIAQGVARMAAGLAARSFAKGDVLAIYSPNIPEYALVFLATASLGGVNTTVNPLYTEQELAQQLRDSNAKYLVTVPAFLEKALQAARGTSIREVFVIGGGDGATPLDALLDHDEPTPNTEVDPQQDLVVLPYSSGTTGLPKGVMLTHYNLVANICQFKDLETYGEADTLIGILPFFHIYGMTVIMGAALHKGATVVCMPRFDLEQFLKTLQDYRVSWAYLVPPIVLALAKHPLVDQFDLSGLRSILSGAAPLGKEVADACAERLGCVVRQGYGLTECSPVTHFTPHDPSLIKTGAIGPLLANTEAKIVDTQSGAELGVE